MNVNRKNLISTIIRKKIYEEITQILSISRQGFDVFAQVEFSEVQDLLLELLNDELKINPREFKLIYVKNGVMKCNDDWEEAECFMPTLLVGEARVDSGFGFVRYNVRTPDQLIGNVAAAVEMILEYYRLELYIDVFDAKKLSRLKQIARVQGIRALIDAVVHTAYYGGYKGDLDLAQSHLDQAEFLIESSPEVEDLPLESCAKKFLAHVLTHGRDAHSFLKSCLSYYTVSKQGHTMTRASQILSISRTTLQEHLKIAGQLGVSSFLDGTNFKNTL